MIKQIVQHSSKLIEFLALLQLSLSKPQMRHVLRITEGVIVSDAPHKTLARLYDIMVEAPDVSNGADFLRISPWSVEEDLRAPQRIFVVEELKRVSEMTGDRVLYVSIDDSLTDKDPGTRHLEPVDVHHDHTKGSKRKPAYTNGTVHVEVRLQLAGCAYVFDFALYMREKTVRRLNRKRKKGRRLRFRSKYNLVREILQKLKQLLPPEFIVYVLFDSWYASNKLLKYCHRQGWHVICAIRSNRTLDGIKLSEWNQRLKHQSYTRVTLTTTDLRKRKYFVRTRMGRLKNVPFDVCVLISKRHPGDKRPKYFLCTDLSLSAQQILSIYQKRWPIEVDNYYVKQLLGLGDFRVQSYEAVEKWFALVFLAYNFLLWRLHHAPPEANFKTVADVIRTHRQEHARQVLEAACREALQWQDTTPVFQRFLCQFEPDLT